MTHCRSAREKCSPFWMEGSATLTMVASSTTMNWATQTMTSVSQGLKWRFSDGALTAAEEGEEPDGAGTAERTLGRPRLKPSYVED